MKRQIVMSEDELDQLINKVILNGYNLRYSKPSIHDDVTGWKELRDEMRAEIKRDLLGDKE